MSEEEKAKIKAYFENLRNDQGKAVEIASRSPFAEKSPEDAQFEEEHLDPMTRGLIGGGAMGAIKKVAAQEVAPAFPRLMRYFTDNKMGKFVAPDNTAAAYGIAKEAEQQIPEALRSKYGKILIKE